MRFADTVLTHSKLVSEVKKCFTKSRKDSIISSKGRWYYMPTKAINLRIDTELLEYLQKRADKEHRTLSNMIVSILLTEKECDDEDADIYSDILEIDADYVSHEIIPLSKSL